MWIERRASHLLKRRAAERPVVLVTGARQVGKTRLAQETFPSHRYVSLDLPSDAALADEDPETFLRQNPPPLIIDEVQYAPGLFRHLKLAVDRERGEAGRFILTGSQKLPLMKSVSDSLAGRAGIIELEGLSWAEIKAARPKTTVEEALVRGGFPELYEKPELDGPAWYGAYVSTYLDRDVRTLHGVGSLRDFERFVRALALRTAGLLNKADLARDIGVSGPTAAAWLSVLEASGTVAFLEPWFGNKTKSLVKRSKVYLADAGLASFLVGIHDEDDLLDSPLAGALWETMVFSELRRRRQSEAGSWSLWFWRDRSKEADFLEHRGGRFDLADAKLGAGPSKDDAAQLRRVAGELPAGSVDSLSVICRTDREYPLGELARALPLEADWPSGRSP